MVRLFTLLAAAALLLPAPGRAAEEWGIEFEEVTRVDAKVVDLLCELTGDCPANCGEGRRQLGLVLADGTLVPVVKNNDPFAGATNDLIGFCGKTITADGLMIRDPAMPLFQIQFKRLAPDGKWRRANQFTKDWSTANGGETAKGWFRKDARVKRLIAEQGVFGIPGLKPEE